MTLQGEPTRLATSHAFSDALILSNTVASNAFVFSCHSTDKVMREFEFSALLIASLSTVVA